MLSFSSQVRRLKEKGSAITSYAVLLAFICILGFTLLGTSGLGNGVDSVVSAVERMLGVKSISELVTEYTNKIFGNKGLYKDSSYSNYQNYIIGSYNTKVTVKDGQTDSRDNNTITNDSVSLSSQIQNYIEQMGIADDIKSWRYVGNDDKGVLFLSPTEWDSKTGGNANAIAIVNGSDGKTNYYIVNLGYVPADKNLVVGSASGRPYIEASKGESTLGVLTDKNGGGKILTNTSNGGQDWSSAGANVFAINNNYVTYDNYADAKAALDKLNQ